MKIEEFNKDYPKIFSDKNEKRNLFTVKLLEMVTEEQAEKIISLVLNTCHHCYDNDDFCQCWNDE